VPGPPRSKTPAIVATAVTGAVAIGGVGAYLRARKLVDEAETFQGTDEVAFEQKTDKARTWLWISRGLGAVAIAGAGVSGYLWYRATRSTTTTVEVAPTGNGASVTVGGRF
jgi:hypothetical protein